MTATTKPRGDSDALLALAVLAAVLTVALTVTAAAHLAVWWTGGEPLPGNPAEVLLGLRTGATPWPAAAWWALAGVWTPLLALGVAFAVVVHRWRRGRARVDRAAKHMGWGRDLAPLRTLGARAIADRLGVDHDTPGLPIGVAVGGGGMLWQDWESVAVHVWGPRQGKTTSAAVPAILAAPGAVLATSNKRDLTDGTRDVRAEAGTIWVFDPQGICDEPPTWHWDPLTYVTDEVQALKLARVLVNAARDPGARTDAYFDKAGPSLIGHLLHAAALAGRPITQVYLWLTDPTEAEPADLLRDHGFELSARAVEGVVHAPEKQRGGIYGTAQELLSFLVSRKAAEWVVPEGRRPAFSPAEFVRSTDTLYLLSREGDGSTGPLVTALTVAVTEAAEQYARVSPRGRLPVPLVLVLDEAANICRWHALPDLYSHFGSRGIPVITFLQSWSQGVDVWGREGMRKLWSAANVRVLGSGVAEDEFLAGLAKLVGTYRRRTRSGSTSRGAHTRSWGEHDDAVLDVADLSALPRGRAVLFASGARPVLLRTVPWTEGPHAAAVRRSLEAHDPASAPAPVEVDGPAASSAWTS